VRLVKFAKIVVQRIEEDELSIRSAALSYYFILSVFPLLLFLLSIVTLFAKHDPQLRQSITSGLDKMAPASASQLVHRVVSRTFTAKHNALKLAVGIGGTLWAASSAIGAIMTALNVVYDKKETRPWWKQELTALALTIAISALFVFALLLALYGGKIGGAISAFVGMGAFFRWAWKIVQWPVSFAVMLFAFSILYCFAPDFKNKKWHWITAGNLTGVTLWIVASILFRIYLHFSNSYTSTYGSLGAVIILLLWLYITGFAILIGGAVNRIIEQGETNGRTLKPEVRETVSTPSKAA
jgi:membrane protein